MVSTDPITAQVSQPAVEGMLTEYLENPLGIDNPKPGFSWRIKSPVRGTAQKAYQIQVATSKMLLRTGKPDMWNSGKVVSDRCTGIPYGGKAFKSSTRYFWRVRVWDENDKTGHFSDYASFETALLSPREWHGKWISPKDAKSPNKPDQASPILRKEFAINKQVTSARAYVTGLGYYELYLNGKKVGDRVLDPPYTNFDKRVYYSVYDVTRLLAQGTNCVGTMLGQGWWKNTPRFLLQLNVTFSDGTKTSVVTDENWKWTPGPIMENSIYHGELYDARKEQSDWNRAGCDDSNWQSAAAVDFSQARLCVQTIQPIKVTETITPRTMTTPKPGVYVFDFGQNFSGWCKIKMSGPAGTEVKLRHAELLYEDGTVNQENLRSARATDRYILKGQGQESYEPRFTYHGFRYAQVEGYPGTPSLGSITGRVVHTSFKPRGRFTCSNELLNQIQHCAVWGEKTNFHAIPTDCPQRDERQGWMGDAHMSADSMLQNFDMPPAYVKFLNDIKDAQGEDGSVPDTVPHVWGGQQGDPMWSAAYPLILWDMYRHTGDVGLLKEHYDGIKRYVDSLQEEAKDYIITRNSYGDWIAVVGTPKPLVSTGSFYLVSDLLVDMAEALGKKDDVKTYRELCNHIEEAFNREFFHIDTKQYGNASQFSNAFPLYLGIVPENFHKDVFANLVKDIEDRKGHLSTGFIGTPYLMDVLVREGRADVAYTIATREDYPGWGYMIKNGATTIWELWELKTGNSMNSHNHPALGLISGWFYRTLAGISPDPKQPGWRHFTIKPYVLGDLKWADASVPTLRGPVESKWSRTDNGLKLDINIPAGSTAAIYIPKAGSGIFDIRESNNIIWRDCAYVSGTEGITGGEDAGEWVKFDVKSGSYSFELENRGPIPLVTGSVYIPEFCKPENGTVDLIVHLHGSPERVRQCFIKSGRKAALVTVAYNGLSAVYSKPFSKDPMLFGKILEDAKAKIAERFGLKEVKIGRLVLSSFSAGFGAVREILKSPEYNAAITDIVLADTLYAGYIKKDGKDAVDPDDMASFEDFTSRAAKGEVNFWISYSGVVPPGYASTFETAEYLLNKVGGKLEPATGNDAPGLDLVTKADVGNFHVHGYAGNDGPAHMQHLFNLDVFYKQTSLTKMR